MTHNWDVTHENYNTFCTYSASCSCGLYVDEVQVQHKEGDNDECWRTRQRLNVWGRTHGE